MAIVFHVGSKNAASTTPALSETAKSGADATGRSGWKCVRSDSDPGTANTAPECREVVGVDLSEAMLRVARRKTHAPNVRFLHADATELPLEDESFDVACISFALHEMPPTIRAKVLRQMVRITSETVPSSSPTTGFRAYRSPRR